MKAHTTIHNSTQPHTTLRNPIRSHTTPHNPPLIGCWSPRRLLKYLVPLSTFFIMPVFALANMAIGLGGADAAAVSASITPALGVAGGLVIGKPLGIFASSWIAQKIGLAAFPEGMTKRHVGLVGMLGGIGFTMCLLLTEVSISGPRQIVPKLAVLAASGFAAASSAFFMQKLPPQADLKTKTA